jgi:hypothetical protein
MAEAEDPLWVPLQPIDAVGGELEVGEAIGTDLSRAMVRNRRERFSPGRGIGRWFRT